jgi:translocation and assembly module TamB
MNWKKIAGWTLAGLLALMVLAAVGGYFYLQSGSFQEFAIRKIIAQVDQSTGGRAEIRAFDFDLRSLTAHLYGIVVHGKESPDAPPLLAVDKLTVGLKILSVIPRQVSLSELLIEHPVVHMQVDRSGNSNIPDAPPQPAESSSNVFDLAVGHFGLSNGEVNYNDRKTPLVADLHDLRTDVKFETLARRYSGSIAYDNGHLRYDKYAPKTHSFNASFTATPSRFELKSAAISVASSTIKLVGDVTDYSAPTAQGTYNIALHAQDFADLAPEQKTSGDIALKGNFHYQDSSDKPFLKSIEIDGDARSEVLASVISGRRIEVRNFHGQYEVANGSLRAKNIRTEMLGGSITGNLDVDHLDTTPSSHLQASVRGISLNAAQHSFVGTELKPVSISGRLDGTADASWSGSISNIRARVDAVLRSAEARSTQRDAGKTSARNIPVDGAIHALYDGRTNVLTLHQTSLHIPAASLTAEGQVSNHSRLQIQAQSSNLQQLVDLASAFRPAQAGEPLVGGSATVNATVKGSMQKPEVSAQMNAQNLQVQGSEWKSANLSLQADPSRIIISNGTLVNAHRGMASFDATVALGNWSYLPSSPIQAHVSVRQMQVADLQHLAKLQYPVSGEVAANIFVIGSENDPRGSGTIEVADARAYDEPLKSLKLTFHGDKGSIVSDAHLATDAGSLDANLSYTLQTRTYKLHLAAPAIVLQKLHAVQQKNLGVQGTVTVAANGEGTIDNPQLTASIKLPKLQVQDKSILGISADLRVANKRADLSIDSQVAQATIRARGHVDLAGDYQTDASIDTSAVPLEGLLAAFSNRVPDGFSGQTELHATLKGPLKNKDLLEAHLVIPTLTASYQSLQIGAASPIRADYAKSVITLQPSEIRGTDTSLRVQGSVPFGGTSVPTLTASGSLDAKIFRIFSPDLRSSGTIALDVRATGSAASPQVSGQIHLQNIAFATDAAPLGIDKLNGTLDLNNERVQISNLTAQVGGGNISIGGSMVYRPSPQFNIALKANSVRLRYPDGLRYVLDGNLAWTGNMSASILQGRVLVDSLSFTPDFDLASFGDQFSGNAAVPAVPGFADTIRMQIAVQSKENLSATSSQISLEGSAALNVTGTAANPVITGRTDLTSGELFYRNVRYQLQRGIITLADPNETRPNLDVSVSTTIEQYNLTLNLRGPFDSLTTSYSSDPPLATADIINLIARGKTSSELAAQSQSTDSMIASQALSQVGGSLQKLAGISSLEIDPSAGGNSQNPSTRVGIQQRVTKNFLFTFSTDVSQPGEEIVQGDYQINKRWSVSVARDQLGGVTVDGRFHTKF